MESALALVAATWALAMALGPLLQVRTILRHGSSRTVSLGYYLVLFVGFVLWLAYGLSASNLTLIVPNAVAVVVAAVTIAVVVWYRRRPRRG